MAMETLERGSHMHRRGPRQSGHTREKRRDGNGASVTGTALPLDADHTQEG